MKRSDLKELIKKSMVEVAPKKDSGAMTPEEEKMVADYEEEKANKYAVGPKEEPGLGEGSVTLNSDEVYAKYAPLVQKYKAKGMDKYQAIAQAEKDLARHYGATPMNIASFVDDYSKKQYMGGDEDSIDAFADEREHDVLREADDIVAAYAEKKTLKEADLSQANFNDLNQVVRNIAHVNEVRMEEAAMQAIEYIAEQFDVPVDFKDFN
jgi:acetyl/propionyl-CoA carboxylase alpha subunit